jgi:hypothetical protein
MKITVKIDTNFVLLVQIQPYIVRFCLLLCGKYEEALKLKAIPEKERDSQFVLLFFFSRSCFFAIVQYHPGSQAVSTVDLISDSISLNRTSILARAVHGLFKYYLCVCFKILFE